MAGRRFSNRPALSESINMMSENVSTVIDGAQTIEPSDLASTTG